MGQGFQKYLARSAEAAIIRSMSENPYLRSIRIFDPRVDLSEDKRNKPHRSITESGGDLFEELQDSGATQPENATGKAGSTGASSDGLEVVEDESMEIIDL